MFTKTNGQLNYTTDNSNSGIIFSKLTSAYISHESCTIFFYHDMTDLYHMGNQIEIALNNVRLECDRTSDVGCGIKTSILDEQFHYAQRNLEKLHHKSRAPRFVLCKWCGKVLHHVYGIVDAYEAEEIIDVINNSSEAIKENRRIIYNTTHIVKTILDEEERKINYLQNTLKQFYSELKGEIDEKLKII